MAEDSIEVAEAERVAAFLKQFTKRLYELRCGETMTHPTGVPICMRVPGGWIFYTAGGGGSLQLVTGDDGEEQQVVGQLQRDLTGVFVPYSEEYLTRVVRP